MNPIVKMFQDLQAWLAGKPMLKNLLDGLVKALILGAVGYIGANVFPDKASTFTWAGFGGVLVVILKSYAQHALDVYLLSASGNTPAQALQAKRVKLGIVPVVLLALMVCGVASAWEVPAKNLGLSNNQLKFTPALGGEDDLVLMPTASLGFGVGSANPSYGYSGAWDLVFGHVTQGTQVGTANLVPYLGVGAALYVDLADFINSGTKSPVKADGGLNLIGPQIEGLVPTAQWVWNFQTGEEVKIIGFSAPFGLFSDDALLKVFGL